MSSLLVFNRVYRLEIVNYRPSAFSLVHLPPPLLVSISTGRYIIIQCVTGGGEGLGYVESIYRSNKLCTCI
jgi:hypothetical protein